MSSTTAVGSIDASINHASKTPGTLRSTKHELEKEYLMTLKISFIWWRRICGRFLLELQADVTLVKENIAMVPASLSYVDK